MQRVPDLSLVGRAPGSGPPGSELLADGDIFQASIFPQLAADLHGDPLDAFCATAAQLDPPYAAFLSLGEGAIASLRPERSCAAPAHLSGHHRSRAPAPARRLPQMTGLGTAGVSAPFTLVGKEIGKVCAR
jgi:hypothetical protein